MLTFENTSYLDLRHILLLHSWQYCHAQAQYQVATGCSPLGVTLKHPTHWHHY
jgi:hypothetical protein